MGIQRSWYFYMDVQQREANDVQRARKTARSYF